MTTDADDFGNRIAPAGSGPVENPPHNARDRPAGPLEQFLVWIFASLFATFAPLVREAGLEFRGLPADTRAHGGVRGSRDLMRAAAEFTTELGRGFADVMADGEPDLLLLSTTTAPLGWHLAEATGVPSLGVYLQPTAPTGDFPPAVLPGSRSLGRPGNRVAGRFALRMTDRVYEQATRDLRHRLRLPPLAASAMRRRQERANWPVLYGFSTALLPRPSDWRPGSLTVCT